MKWLKRIAIGLVAVVVVLGAAIWLWLPPVNIPFEGMLANVAPRLFSVPTADAATIKSRLSVPAGFGIGLFARDIPEARMLRMTARGDVLVASPAKDRVYWLSHELNGDGESADRRVLLEGLDGPNGLDFWNGYLYVAEQDKVGRVQFDDNAGNIVGKYEVVIDGLPRGGNHWKKTIRFGPDGLLYLAIGSSCNVCLEEDDRRAAMLRYTPDGKFVDVYATGLRNSAGFDWRADGTLYATDNGRDLLGDDFPPCELNQIRQGGFYGWPFANGDRVPDPDLGAGREAVIEASIPPAFSFRAHNAPLGIVFLRSDRQVAAFRGDALVALHGSWNRSRKDGYKVVALRWNADGSISAEDFLTGFLKNENVIGRPAELTEAPDGTIYVSDDYANAVYRIVPGGTQNARNRRSCGAVARCRYVARRCATDRAGRNRVRPTRMSGVSRTGWRRQGRTFGARRADGALRCRIARELSGAAAATDAAGRRRRCASGACGVPAGSTGAARNDVARNDVARNDVAGKDALVQ